MGLVHDSRRTGSKKDKKRINFDRKPPVFDMETKNGNFCVRTPVAFYKSFKRKMGQGKEILFSKKMPDDIFIITVIHIVLF